MPKPRDDLTAPAGSGVSPLNRSNLDAAIIDLDGTLVDTLGDFAAAIHLMLTELLPPERLTLLPDASVIGQMVGKGSEHLVRSTLKHVQALMNQAGDATDLVANYDLAITRYQAHYAAINGRHSAVYPGVVEGLSALRRAGLPLACLTNKPTAFARELLRLKALDGFFLQVFGGDSFERKKPDPLPVLKTCEQLGTLPSRTLVIGDSSNDAQAARAAGCPVLLVTYGYNHGQSVREVDADGLITSLTEALRAKALRFDVT